MEEQVLILGDGCFTIVYKKSIIFNPALPNLECGSKILYYWPEEAACKRIYNGTIIKVSSKHKQHFNDARKI